MERDRKRRGGEGRGDRRPASRAGARCEIPCGSRPRCIQHLIPEGIFFHPFSISRGVEGKCREESRMEAPGAPPGSLVGFGDGGWRMADGGGRKGER